MFRLHFIGIKGTTYTARDIADPTSVCSWNPDMYGVDMDKPGAQAYYDSRERLGFPMIANLNKAA